MICINQNKLTCTLGTMILVCLMLPATISAQALKVSIKVNTTVGMQQSMPFEAMPENNMKASVNGESSPKRSINTLGSFTMTGKENTDVMVRLDAPGVLVNKNNQTMPYQMQVAWQNNVSGDVNNLKWSNSKDNTFKLTSNLNSVEKKKTQDGDLQASLYLKGIYEASANSDSPFEGNVKLTIEY